MGHFDSLHSVALRNPIFFPPPSVQERQQSQLLLQLLGQQATLYLKQLCTSHAISVDRLQQIVSENYVTEMCSEEQISSTNPFAGCCPYHWRRCLVLCIV
jgi:hypothetical protein